MLSVKRVLSFIIIVFLSTACGQQKEVNNSSPYKQEGVIVEIKQINNNLKQLLLIPNTKFEDISNKNDNELHRMAEEKDGAFYSFDSSEYNHIEVGMKVIVHWDGSQDDSIPPYRGADNIEVVLGK